MSKVLFLIIIMIVFSRENSQSQTLQNVHAAFDGEKVHVTYDLLDKDPSQQFKVSLYSSHDNYSIPLAALTGDVGDAVSAGKNKSVNWNVRSALSPDFDNIISIKVKALKIVKTVPVTDPLPASSSSAKLALQPFTRTAFKKGEKIELRWSGANAVKKINIVLLKDNVIHTMIAENIANDQSFVWQIPKQNKTGKNYSIHVVDIDKPSEFTSTPSFTIRPRTSYTVKALPVLVVAGVAAVVLLDSDKASSDELPGPINPD
jgi:hypothetical protein